MTTGVRKSTFLKIVPIPKAPERCGLRLHELWKKWTLWSKLITLCNQLGLWCQDFAPGFHAALCFTHRCEWCIILAAEIERLLSCSLSLQCASRWESWRQLRPWLAALSEAVALCRLQVPLIPSALLNVRTAAFYTPAYVCGVLSSENLVSAGACGYKFLAVGLRVIRVKS